MQRISWMVGWLVALAALGVNAQTPPPPPEPAPEPAPAPEPTPEPAPAPEPAPEPAPAPASAPEPAAGPASAPEPAPAPAPVPASVPVPVPEREPEPEPEPAPAADEPVFGAVAVVPVPGPGQALRKVPRNVQRVDGALIAEHHALGLHDALELRLAGVVVNDVQNNPLQPDLQYRGFTASPLLGSPQGLAVYQNGVRINEAFGDVVQWDLLPEVAVADAQLIPGANPLYGLNALGGSLALRMKDGYGFDGHRVRALGGSFSRHQVSGEYGRDFGPWAFYGAVSHFGEEGFRDESRSSAARLYADLRTRDEAQQLGVNVTLADSDLNGNGLAPVELLADEGRSALFTYPDNTRNRLLMVAADLDRELGERYSLQATAYVRHLARDTVNGDEADLALCDDGMGGGLLCDEDDEPLLSEQGSAIAADAAFDALFNTTETVTDGAGGSLQLSVEEPLASLDNRLVVGTSFDAAHVAFLQRAEAGYLTPERTVLGQRIFLGDDAFRTKLQVDSHYLGLYAADTLDLTDALVLNVAARFDWARIELQDGGASGALDGEHDFTRLNPTIGLAYTPLGALTVFASYGESSRAPSASELACADPDEPCRVPNAFVADPPLDQVVSRSVELGLRGELGDGVRPALRWSVAGHASRNFDDIIFVAGSTVGTGYFRNAGETQRVGGELDLAGEAGALRYFLGYSLLRATFESRLELPGGANPGREDADGGAAGGGDGDDERASIEVEPGDRIPGLPVHSLKLGLVVTPLAGWELGASLLARSGAHFRGDEANLLGELDGYATVGVHTSYQVLPQLQLFARVENLLDSEYETFGLLAEPDEVFPAYDDPRFVGPGAPRALFVGLVLHD